jgi:hypothetical protein
MTEAVFDAECALYDAQRPLYSMWATGFPMMSRDMYAACIARRDAALSRLRTLVKTDKACRVPSDIQ